MKIAFVGKWGSGKTTITAYFIQYLLSRNYTVMWFDADINVWLAETIGIEIKKGRYISHIQITENIRKILIGNNSKIDSIWHFVKTTPPGIGSYIISKQSKDFFEKFCSYEDTYLKFFHVGTYEKEWIGTSCYHTNLSVFENIISHSHTDETSFFVADMVAWNDSFSNTLHSQFDVIFLIVEPTRESVNMAKNFMELWRSTKNSSNIYIVGNKIEDDEDIKYLKDEWIVVNYFVPFKKELKKMRRKWGIEFDEEINSIFSEIFIFLQENITINHSKKLDDLYDLHKKYIELDYIKSPLWNLIGQIDLEFSFPWK